MHYVYLVYEEYFKGLPDWPSSLASHVAISSQVDACPVTPLPFEDHLSTQAQQTGLRPGNH